MKNLNIVKKMKKNQKKSKYSNAINLIAIAGGYKIVDITQKIHDSFKATDMSAWMDGLASGLHHRVEAGHDFIFNAKAVYEKFGFEGLVKDYPIELSKDFLSKNGIPLPGIEGLVKADVIRHKVGTEWLSVNAGDMFSGGLVIYHNYKLYKKSKTEQFNKKGVIWISVGMGVKISAGVLQTNPILIVSGLSDGYILLTNNAEVKKFIKDFLKKAIPPMAVAISTFFGVASATTGAVGTLGVASTGTAISSLSGVAASKATLAWIGGGSIASGGLGVLGGAIILTGGSTLIGVGAGYLVYRHLKNKQKKF